jgi:hypothetical protein
MFTIGYTRDNGVLIDNISNYGIGVSIHGLSTVVCFLGVLSSPEIGVLHHTQIPSVDM